METISVERVVTAPIEDVFDWLSVASNYKRSLFVMRERLAEPGEGTPYGPGAVRQLTWVFGWFRERITEYNAPNEFSYQVERSLPPLRHEGGKLTFTATPEGTRVVWSTTVEMSIPLIGSLMTRLFGKPLIAYTFAKVIDKAQAELGGAGERASQQHAAVG
jgi:uncharacterized protein YndB with AHSA1/START domain